MHAKVFSIQIFQYFQQIPPRVCTLVLFIVQALTYNPGLMHSIPLQMIATEKRVAFIGISNWALDPAKMNRGVMVTRSDPDVMELVLTAEGICSNNESDSLVNSFKYYFKPLAEAYNYICDKQERQFFGLRDFYR